MTIQAEDDAVPPARPRRRRRWLRAFAWLAATLAIFVGAAYWALGSQAALDYVVRRAVARAEGHLTIEGAEGSLLSTVRVARLAWQGDEIDVEATETALAWTPLDLLSRRFIVQGLGAKRLALTFKKSGGSPAGLPTTLALPLEVDVRNIGVQRLEWRTAQSEGHVTGVTFGYSGGAASHAVRALRFVTDDGTLAGNAEVSATAPFALAGTLAFEGDGAYRGGRATLAVSGTLERIGVDAQGTLHNAGATVKATLTPFAPALMVTAAVDARDVDLAQFEASLPATSLSVHLTASPSGPGFAGELTAGNAAAGPIDAGRIPVASLKTNFAWDGQVLALGSAEAQIAGGGSAGGSVSVPVGGGPIALNLTLRNVDLARIQSSLVATRLSGTLAADVTHDRQVVRGDLRQADLALSFAGNVEGRAVTLDRFRLMAGGGELAGNATLALDGARAFMLSARATHFDPARFAAMPQARLDGTLSARGSLRPAWDVTADVTLAKKSRFAGLDVAGSAHVHARPASARDIVANAQVGASTIKLNGALGAPSDTLAFDVDVPRVAELRTLLVRYAKIAVPEPLAGALRAKGTLSGPRAAPGFTVELHGNGLQWGGVVRAATLDIAGSAAPGVGPAGPIPLSQRAVSLTLSGTRVAGVPGEVATLRATVEGTLAAHRAALATKGEGFDLSVAISGSVGETRRPDGTVDTAWTGSLEALSNRGTYAVDLEAPATLAFSRNHVHVGGARLAAAEGRAELRTLDIDEGRISTQGSFTGIPASTVAKLAGRPLPFLSTLTIGGDWSLAATPRLNGSIAVRRERGDWFATESATLDPADLALGITVLTLSARFTDDALAASAQFRSVRAGTLDAEATLAAGRTPGRIDTGAPLTATVTADLASLRPLQPWVGTLAVMDGRAHFDLAARGTLAQPEVTGALTGDALRFDLPQYGVHLREGRLRARVAERAIVLDEFSLKGGSGTFAAKGTLALASAGAEASAAAGHVEWQAEEFTIVNRPDLTLVTDGKGTLAIEGKKLALAGSITVEHGRVEYEPRSVGTLSDDVVIAGQPRKVADAGVRDLPLALDLEVALGRDFRFSGEGLDTRLAGRVRVTTTASGALDAKGSIAAVAGTYYVFGQRLDIDRGRLTFDGPPNNPALDVVALRKNLAVEAGVELTGTVRVPRVRLVSNPPVPDGEKLSWLLTGQGLDRANRADIAMLSAASASLLGQGKKPITTQLANTVGLDDISVRQASGTVTGSTSTQVVAFGKRISDRLSLIYEQGLTVATNALRIEYALTRTLTLRAEAGTVSSVGLYFRRTYD